MTALGQMTSGERNIYKIRSRLTFIQSVISKGGKNTYAIIFPLFSKLNGAVVIHGAEVEAMTCQYHCTYNRHTSCRHGMTVISAGTIIIIIITVRV